MWSDNLGYLLRLDPHTETYERLTFGEDQSSVHPERLEYVAAARDGGLWLLLGERGVAYFDAELRTIGEFVIDLEDPLYGELIDPVIPTSAVTVPPAPWTAGVTSSRIDRSTSFATPLTDSCPGSSLSEAPASARSIGSSTSTSRILSPCRHRPTSATKR